MERPLESIADETQTGDKSGTGWRDTKRSLSGPRNARIYVGQVGRQQTPDNPTVMEREEKEFTRDARMPFCKDRQTRKIGPAGGKISVNWRVRTTPKILGMGSCMDQASWHVIARNVQS